MITTVLQENILKALSRVNRILSAKTQLPILQNILIQTKDGGVQLTATNLDTTESVHIGAKVDKEGSLCIPSRLLLELVSTLPQESVQLEVKESNLSIVCGGSRATIGGVSASEFPQIAPITLDKATKIPKDLFVEALSHVLFAAATDESRPLLTGTLFTSSDNGAKIAATDGYRLSVKSLSQAFPFGDSSIIPAKALGEILHISQEEKETKDILCLITVESQFVCVVGETELRTRLIDGEYPNFEKIIPTKHNTRVVLDTDVFTRAVKSAAIFARDSANIIRFTIEDQSLTVSAATPNIGENKVVVPASTEGEGGEIAFNSRFLLEFLGNHKEEELVFEMTGSLNPGLFKPTKDDSYIHIIMPVRTTQS